MANLRLHHYLIGIFTSILLIFAMSHNASAVETVIDITDYSVTTLAYRLDMYCIIDNVTISNASFCSTSSSGSHSVARITSDDAYSFNEGDIVEFDLLVFNPNTPVNLPSDFLMINNQLIDSTYFTLIGFKDVSSNYDSISVLLDVNDGTITSNSQFYKVIRYIFKVVKSGRSVIGFNTSNANGFPIFRFEGPLNLKFINLNKFEPLNSKDKANQEQEQATQDAVDGSEDAGESSSSSAQSGSASLLNVIGAFAGIITSAQPTNCLINGNMGNLNIGQIDLCANPVPSFVQIIGSIILVCLVIPFVVIMFNRFISIFRSFQS